MSTTFHLTVPTTVATSVPIDLSSITAVLSSAESLLSKDLADMKTATKSAVYQSLTKEEYALRASISYYSLLGVQATATAEAEIASVASEAAYASAVSEQILEEQGMMHGHYPNRGWNIAFLVLFSLILIVQIGFGIYYGQWWFLVCYCLGLLIEITGYAGRVMLSSNLKNLTAYIIQHSCITVAPCFLMAGIYYTLAQLTVIMGQRYSMLKPMQYTFIFVLCDIVSICVQSAGGGVSAASSSNVTQVRLGLNILTGGIGFQIFSMTLFQVLWYVFLWRCYQSKKLYGDAAFDPKFDKIRSRKLFYPLFPAISLSVLLVFIRTIYRIVEMSQGYDSKLSYVEPYFIAFEAVMILLSALLLTVVHPGLAYGRHPGIHFDKGLKNSLSRKTERYHETQPLGRSHELELDRADQT